MVVRYRLYMVNVCGARLGLYIEKHCLFLEKWSRDFSHNSVYLNWF